MNFIYFVLDGSIQSINLNIILLDSLVDLLIEFYRQIVRISCLIHLNSLKILHLNYLFLLQVSQEYNKVPDQNLKSFLS
jgi:hypothetical protein